MRVRLEVNIERSPASLAACGFQSKHFGVLRARVGVASGACDVSLRVNDHRSYAGIRRGQADALAGEVEGTLQELFVGGH
jgi:hypothetical protein